MDAAKSLTLTLCIVLISLCIELFDDHLVVGLARFD
jgi:hypothetical protein